MVAPLSQACGFPANRDLVERLVKLRPRLAGLPLLQENISWAVGFAIPAACMAAAILTFVAGSPLYTHVPPTERWGQGGQCVCVYRIGSGQVRMCARVCGIPPGAGSLAVELHPRAPPGNYRSKQAS